MRLRRWICAIPLRLRSLFRRKQADQELDEELSYHIERKTEEYVARGLDAAAARRQAMLDMDGIERSKEECREARKVSWLHDLVQDARFGVRVLAKTPGFTLVAVLTLALGIGANTAIFSVVNSFMLKPLPVHEPDRLVTLYTSDFSGPDFGSSSYPDYLDFRQRAEVLEDMLAFWRQTVRVGPPAEGEQLAQAEMVTVNYFSVLGLRPLSGRVFQPEEEQGANPVAVLSHAYWLRHFGGDSGLIGKQIVINKVSYTVIGIAPPRFTGLVRGPNCDLWLPISMTTRILRGADWLENRGARAISLVGRLKPGASVAQAQAQFSLIAQQQYAAYPQSWVDSTGGARRITVLPESQSRIPPGARRPATVVAGLVFAVVGLVLAVACANLAGMLLARVITRRKEIAVRVALGATRLRVARMLLVESLLITGLGGALGLLAMWWTTSLVLALLPPIGLDLSPDARVLGFTAAVTLLTGLALGLAPTLQALSTGFTSLKEDSGLSGYRRMRLRNALVMAQISVSVLLLITSGLFLRSMRNLNAVDPGFNAENLLLALVMVEDNSEEAGRQAYRQVLEMLRGRPGVRAVTLVNRPGLDFDGTRRTVYFPDYQPQPGEIMDISFNLVGPGYFAAMQTPILRGRDITEQDVTGAPGVVIINETLARRYFPGQDALGRRLSFSGPNGPFLEIVGIARDGKYRSLQEAPQPFLSLPILQNYQVTGWIVVRAEGEPQLLADSVRDAIRAAHPNLRIEKVLTMTEHIGLALLPMRLGSMAAAAFGLLALSLACLGLYGVVAYFVGRQTREIGIRMALGARQSDILEFVLRQGTRIAGVGIAAGLVGSFLVTRLLSSLLYEVSPTDLMTHLGVTAILVAVSAAACFIPARRASRIEPMSALRYE